MRTEQCFVALTDGRLELRTGRLAPRLTDQGHDRATVSLLATTALLLGGDHVAIRARVGCHQHLRLNDVAATVAYNGRGVQATLEVDIELAEHATLVWHTEPLVLSSGAAVIRGMTVSAAAGARMLLRDQLVLGRTDEPGGSLTCRTRMTYDGTPALAEDLALTPKAAGAGVLGTARVLDTAVALGWRPPAPERGTYFALDAPAAMVRDLVSHTHLSGVPSAWTVWCETISATSTPSGHACSTSRQSSYQRHTIPANTTHDRNLS